MQYRLFNYSILHNIFCFYSFQYSLFVKIQDLDFWVILCHNLSFQLQIYVKFYAQHHPPLINVNNFENLFTLLICNILQKHPTAPSNKLLCNLPCLPIIRRNSLANSMTTDNTSSRQVYTHYITVYLCT